MIIIYNIGEKPTVILYSTLKLVAMLVHRDPKTLLY